VSANAKDITDVVGNAGTDSAQTQTQAFDTKAPTVVISMASTALKGGDGTLVTVDFSESVSGLTLSDFSVDTVNGSLGTFTQVSDTQYTMVYTAVDGKIDSTNVIQLAAGSVVDANGNVNLQTNGLNFSWTMTPRSAGQILSAVRCPLMVALRLPQ